MKTKSWEPKRRGIFYGSSACCGARYCKWADYVRAKRRAARLARHMGKGWTARVHENLGWHYNVFSPCGRICLSEHWGQGRTATRYLALLGEPFSCAGRWSGQARTPQGAINQAISAAKTDLRRIGATLRGLDGICKDGVKRQKVAA